NKVHCIHKFILFALIFSLTLPFFYSCGEKKESAKNQTAQVPSESFTFFDLGRQSTLSRSVRDDLKRRLGRDAIEHRSIIDLDINFYGFLKKYFPSLYALNQNLNFPPGERIEHNTVKLMYRYARKENIPFDYVELVFSNYSQHPLLFRINFQKDEADIIETLKTKYGEPLLIDWKDKSGQSMYWEKNNDLLIVSLVPDQFGNPEYQIRIFFVENIRTLLAAERAEKEKAERQRAKSGKTAF
ncbi:MAG: hypothetical protein PVG15_18780, partial [Desulfobacterales bacterium]